MTTIFPPFVNPDHLVNLLTLSFPVRNFVSLYTFKVLIISFTTLIFVITLIVNVSTTAMRPVHVVKLVTLLLPFTATRLRSLRLPHAVVHDLVKKQQQIVDGECFSILIKFSRYQNVHFLCALFIVLPFANLSLSPSGFSHHFENTPPNTATNNASNLISKLHFSFLAVF